jgi:hypothetical protein
MKGRKQYNHIIETNFMGISDKIRKFVKGNKKKTKGIK